MKQEKREQYPFRGFRIDEAVYKELQKIYEEEEVSWSKLFKIFIKFYKEYGSPRDSNK